VFEISTLTEHFPYLGIFALLILGGIGFPFPEDATLLLSGILTANAVIQPLPAFWVVYSGLLITDFFLYSAGRKYGRRLVEHRRFQRILSPDQFSKLEEKFEKWGTYVIFFGRHVLGFRAQIFLVAGVMRMSVIKFLMVDAISALFTIGLWGGVGYLGGNSIQILKNDIMRIEHIAIVVFLISLVSGIFFWYFKNRGKFKDK
jgi:membrane protein DedA with SNARE-associated domain